MKPLIILLAVSVISLLVLKWSSGVWQLAFSARLGMTAMLLFTALGHFMFPKGMSFMLPEFIPFRIPLIYATGLLEIAFAIGLQLKDYRVLTAWMLIAFLILILPGNVYAAMRNLDYQKATFDGPGLMYLWFRIPLQVFFAGWVYWAAIKY